MFMPFLQLQISDTGITIIEAELGGLGAAILTILGYVIASGKKIARIEQFLRDKFNAKLV